MVHVPIDDQHTVQAEFGGGGAGGLEAGITVLAIRDGIAPPTINYDTPDPECDLDYVPNKARRAKIDYALSNSFGFGGTNGSLIFKRYGV